MTAVECITERRRTQGGQVVVAVWHAVAGPAVNEASWRRIVCGGGIAFPGNSRVVEPTCPECAAQLSDRTGADRG